MIAKIKFEGDFEYDYIYYSNNLNIDIDSFLKWIYEDKSHPFWIRNNNGEIEGVDYRGNALVYWINNHMDIINDDNAYIVKECTIEDLDYDLVFTF